MRRQQIFTIWEKILIISRSFTIWQRKLLEEICGKHFLLGEQFLTWALSGTQNNSSCKNKLLGSDAKNQILSQIVLSVAKNGQECFESFWRSSRSVLHIAGYMWLLNYDNKTSRSSFSLLLLLWFKRLRKVHEKHNSRRQQRPFKCSNFFSIFHLNLNQRLEYQHMSLLPRLNPETGRHIWVTFVLTFVIINATKQRYSLLP